MEEEIGKSPKFKSNEGNTDKYTGIESQDKEEEIPRSEQSNQKEEEIMINKIKLKPEIPSEIRSDFPYKPKCISLEYNVYDPDKVFSKVRAIEMDLECQTTNYKYKWKVIRAIKDAKNFLSQVIFWITNNNIDIEDKDLLTDMNTIRNLSPKKVMEQIHKSKLLEIMNLILFLETLYKGVFILEFFEISNTSFDDDVNFGIKPNEGYIRKRQEYNTCQSTFISMCSCWKPVCCSSYNNYWFSVSDNVVKYADNNYSNTKGKSTFFFDKDTRIEYQGKYIILRQGNGKKIKLYFPKDYEQRWWSAIFEEKLKNFQDNLNKNPTIKLNFNSTIKEETDKSIFNNLNSFTTLKKDNKAKWFVDGNDYYRDLKENLLASTESVYITDWWMSPELYLTRPVNFKTYKDKKYSEEPYIESTQLATRLCDILYYIAEVKKVKVYILVYKEKEIALTLNSEHTMTLLEKFSSNIKVVRHPIKINDILWSHHEKLVVIDQRIAYVGGLDLCWGRYDTFEHPLWEPKNEAEIYYYPGIGYNNARIVDFDNVNEYLKESVDREKEPRMPWHDIHSKLEGPAALDIARHFIERYNYIKSYEDEEGITEVKNKYVKKRQRLKRKTAIILPKRTFYEGPEDGGKADEEKNFEKVERVNEVPEDFKKMDSNIINIEKEPSRFVKLIAAASKKQGKLPQVPSSLNFLSKLFAVAFKEGERKMSCQCLRSLSLWSGGLKETENSILRGYQNLIKNSKHYIYIENQFFISKTFTDEENEEKGCPVSDLVYNQIGLYIRNRILDADKKGEKFRVYIFIPLLPGFAGDFDSSSTLQVVCKFTYKTISRNSGFSLIEKLKELLTKETYDKYIAFYSLRNHAVINDMPVTEIIYIHSKLMIVDDRYVLIGSANINDRSMLGERDSEFAVIYNEQNYAKSVMDGNIYDASEFAKSLRKRIWYEHLGIDFTNEEKFLLEKKELDDPICDETWEYFQSIALSNTNIYRAIFRCFPDDYITKFDQLQKIEGEQNIEMMKKRYYDKKDDIKGHIVQFPTEFLKDEILNRAFFSCEMLLPIKNFV